MESIVSLGDRKSGAPGPSRRTVLKGAAWSLPVIAAATAVPFAAASTGEVAISSAGQACKLPGGSCGKDLSKGYLQPLTLSNPTSESITFTIPSPVTLLLGGVSTSFTVSPTTFTVAPGEEMSAELHIFDRQGSPQTSITGTIPWSYAGGSGTTTINTAQTPPCVGCTSLP